MWMSHVESMNRKYMGWLATMQSIVGHKREQITRPVVED